jgi:hypothetical protein
MPAWCWPPLLSHFPRPAGEERGSGHAAPQILRSGSLYVTLVSLDSFVSTLPHGNAEGGEARLQPVLDTALHQILLPLQHAGD